MTGPSGVGRGVSIRAVVAASIGNAVEWFDWTIYATFAIFFAPSFFPASDETAALLSVFGIFAVGFFMRPLGGWVLGVFADRYGRRTALAVTIVMMSLGSLLVAVLPTYEAIGIAAPVLLTLARLVQGLSAGGEFGSASTFLAESAPPERRAFVCSFFYLGIAGGLLLASGIGTVLAAVLSDDQMHSWGWRVPFLVGALGALVGLLLRRRVPETAAFTKVREDARRVRRPLVTMVTRHPVSVLRVVGFTLLGTLAFYLFVSVFPGYVVQSTGADKSTAFLANTIGLAVFLVAQPVFGRLADRIGRRPQLLAFSVGTGVFVVPLAHVVNDAFPVILAVQVVGLLLIAPYTAVAPALYAEQFPTEVRTVGIGAPYNVTVALFGGTAPYLLTWLSARGLGDLFFWYLVVAAAVSTVAFLTMRETRAVSLDAAPAASVDLTPSS